MKITMLFGLLSLFIAMLTTPRSQSPTLITQLRLTIEAHPGAVAAVAFTPDGRFVASCGADSTYRGRGDYNIRLWDPVTGKAKAAFAGHTDSVGALAINPDGKALVSISIDGSVRLWDIATGTGHRLDLGHHGPIAFSPDGKILASGGNDHKIAFWETATWKKRAEVEVPPDGKVPRTGVVALAFSPDGKSLASASADTMIRIWDVATGKNTASFQVFEKKFGVLSLAFSPDGRIIASGGSQNMGIAVNPGRGKPFVPGPEIADCGVHLVEVASGKIRANLKGHSSIANRFAFSPDGKVLASGSMDSTIRLWEMATGKSVVVLTGHTGYVRSVAFSPDGQSLASGSADGTIKLWDVQPSKVK